VKNPGSHINDDDYEDDDDNDDDEKEGKDIESNTSSAEP
jgi:hypothetical protein